MTADGLLREQVEERADRTDPVAPETSLAAGGKQENEADLTQQEFTQEGEKDGFVDLNTISQQSVHNQGAT